MGGYWSLGTYFLQRKKMGWLNDAKSRVLLSAVFFFSDTFDLIPVLRSCCSVVLFLDTTYIILCGAYLWGLSRKPLYFFHISMHKKSHISSYRKDIYGRKF